MSATIAPEAKMHLLNNSGNWSRYPCVLNSHAVSGPVQDILLFEADQKTAPTTAATGNWRHPREASTHRSCQGSKKEAIEEQGAAAEELSWDGSSYQQPKEK